MNAIETILEVDAFEVGRRLQRTRKIAKISQQQVAERLGVSRPTIVALESGQRRLPPMLLASLAEAYGLPISDLIRPHAAQVALGTQLRVPAGVDVKDKEQVDQAVGLLERLIDDYAYVESVAGTPTSPSPTTIYSYTSQGLIYEAEAIAATERRKLGVGDGPVLGLRELLESEAGIRVFSIRLPGKVAGLFAISSAVGPCVAINSDHPWTRQRWTLAHEYAHFLTRAPEVTLLGEHSRRPEHERFADRFAGAFLMEEGGLERRLRRLTGNERNISVADILLLAREYGVSAEAMVVRMEDLRLVPIGTWDRLEASGVNVRGAAKHMGLEAEEPDKRQLPLRQIFVSLEAYDGGLLTEGQLARLLGMDRLSARELIAKWSSADVNESGLPKMATLSGADVVELNE